MQSASLYHHIGSKDDLLYSVCVESVSRMREATEHAIASADDPVAQIHALIEAHVRASLAEQDAHATMLSELRSLGESRRAEVVALRDEYEALVTETLARAQNAGAVRNDIPARSLTLALLSLLNWPIFWFRPEGELTPEALADLLASIFLDGALTT
jgi:TetR/AcrR family transcriptional regulator, cholesterol catabolism regulator